MSKGKGTIVINLAVMSYTPRMGNHVDLKMDTSVEQQFRDHLKECPTCKKLVRMILLDAQMELTEESTIKRPDNVRIINSDPEEGKVQ